MKAFAEREESLMNSKILTEENRDEIIEKLRAEGKKIIHCHGAFDLVHPGHLLHFSEAKKLGDVLVVTVTAAKYMQKGPGRPYFDDDMRLMGLSCLEMIDYVMLSEEVTAFGVIDILKPALYVKGAEYSKSEDDVTGNIDAEVSRVRLHGGDVYFTGGDVFSSTKLINNVFNVLPEKAKEFARELKESADAEFIAEEVNKFSKLSVLVVGDVIIDEYIHTAPLGLMSKDQAVATKYLSTERFLGGSLAVARHIAGFCDNVTLCAITGTEAEAVGKIKEEMSESINLEVIYDELSQTVIKRKYVAKHGLRDEYNKLFAVNFLGGEGAKTGADAKVRAKFMKNLECLIASHDMVVVCDYGHGLIDRATIRLLEEKSKYLALNCQTNSSNYGVNLITKYSRVDCFTLDEKEIILALCDNSSPREDMIKSLTELLSADCGILTLGSSGAMMSDADGNITSCPAMALEAIDTIGAGDALFSIACLAMYCKLHDKVTLLLGNIAGAIIANELNNSVSINKAKVLKFVQTVLNV